MLFCLLLLFIPFWAYLHVPSSCYPLRSSDLEILWLTWDQLTLVTLGTLPGATFPTPDSHILRSSLGPKPQSPEVGEGSVEVETCTRGGTLPFRKQLDQRTLGVATCWGQTGGNVQLSSGKQPARGLVPLLGASGVYAVPWQQGTGRKLSQGDKGPSDGKKQTGTLGGEHTM